MSDQPVCPTPCDEDCTAFCHEVHQPGWKRNHQPEDCTTALAFERGEFCDDVIDLVTFGGGIPIPQAVRDELISKIRERDQRMVEYGQDQMERWLQGGDTGGGRAVG